jgi:hypothetical protein
MAYQLTDANAALGKLGFEATHIIRMKINHPENELTDKKTPMLSKKNEATAAENGLQSVLRWRRSQQPSDWRRLCAIKCLFTMGR